MKLKVSSNLKNKLSISFSNLTYGSNDEIEVTKEQFFLEEIQNLLQTGIVENMSSDKQTQKDSLSYRNISKNKISFSWGLTVYPNSVFNLQKEKENNSEVASLVKSGFIEIDQGNKDLSTKEKPVVKAKSKKEKVSPSLAKEKESYIDQQIKDLDNESDSDLEFVDIKQKKEKLVKLKNLSRKEG